METLSQLPEPAPDQEAPGYTPRHDLWAAIFAASSLTTVSVLVEKIADESHVREPRASVLLGAVATVALVSGVKMLRNIKASLYGSDEPSTESEVNGQSFDNVE